MGDEISLDQLVPLGINNYHNRKKALVYAAAVVNLVRGAADLLSAYKSAVDVEGAYAEYGTESNPFSYYRTGLENALNRFGFSGGNLNLLNQLDIEQGLKERIIRYLKANYLIKILMEILFSSK